MENQVSHFKDKWPVFLTTNRKLGIDLLSSLKDVILRRANDGICPNYTTTFRIEIILLSSKYTFDANFYTCIVLFQPNYTYMS